MIEVEEMTMPSVAAVLLRNELRQLIKHCDLDQDVAIAFINLAEGLVSCDEVRITIVSEDRT